MYIYMCICINNGNYIICIEFHFYIIYNTLYPEYHQPYMVCSTHWDCLRGYSPFSIAALFQIFHVYTERRGELFHPESICCFVLAENPFA